MIQGIPPTTGDFRGLSSGDAKSNCSHTCRSSCRGWTLVRGGRIQPRYVDVPDSSQFRSRPAAVSSTSPFAQVQSSIVCASARPTTHPPSTTRRKPFMQTPRTSVGAGRVAAWGRRWDASSHTTAVPAASGKPLITRGRSRIVVRRAISIRCCKRENGVLGWKTSYTHRYRISRRVTAMLVTQRRIWSRDGQFIPETYALVERYRWDPVISHVFSSMLATPPLRDQESHGA